MQTLVINFNKRERIAHVPKFKSNGNPINSCFKRPHSPNREGSEAKTVKFSFDGFPTPPSPSHKENNDQTPRLIAMLLNWSVYSLMDVKFTSQRFWQTPPEVPYSYRSVDHHEKYVSISISISTLSFLQKCIVLNE